MLNIIINYILKDQTRFSRRKAIKTVGSVALLGSIILLASPLFISRASAEQQKRQKDKKDGAGWKSKEASKKEKMEAWNKLDENEKQAIKKEKMEAWKKLSEEEKQAIKDKKKEYWDNLSEEEKQAIKKKIRTIKKKIRDKRGKKRGEKSKSKKIWEKLNKEQTEILKNKIVELRKSKATGIEIREAVAKQLEEWGITS